MPPAVWSWVPRGCGRPGRGGQLSARGWLQTGGLSGSAPRQSGGSQKGPECSLGWSPSVGRGGRAVSWPGGQQSSPCPPAEEVLESYENPPPIILPSEGFQVDLEAGCLDDSVYQHLLYLRHFLWGLQSRPSPGGGASQPQGPEVPLSCWSGAGLGLVWASSLGGGATQGLAARPGEVGGTAGGPRPPPRDRSCSLLPERFLSCRARPTPLRRGTPRARAAPSPPGAPAGELVRAARGTLSPRPGLLGPRALQKGSRAGAAAGAPRTQTPPACSRLPAHHSSLPSPTGPTPAAPVGKRPWTGGGTDQASEGRLQKVRATCAQFPPAPAPGPVRRERGGGSGGLCGWRGDGGAWGAPSAEPQRPPGDSRSLREAGVLGQLQEFPGAPSRHTGVSPTSSPRSPSPDGGPGALFLWRSSWPTVPGSQTLGTGAGHRPSPAPFLPTPLKETAWLPRTSPLRPPPAPMTSAPSSWWSWSEAPPGWGWV